MHGFLCQRTNPSAPLHPLQKHSAVIFGTGQPDLKVFYESFCQDSPRIGPNLFYAQILRFLVRILLNLVRQYCHLVVPQYYQIGLLLSYRESLGWDLDPRPLPYQGNALPG